MQKIVQACILMLQKFQRGDMMFYLENIFIRILFVVGMQFLCLTGAIFGTVCAGECDKWGGVIRFLSNLAVSLVWLVIGSIILPFFSFSHSLSGLTIYTAWGMGGIMPFLFSLCNARKRENPSVVKETILGVITVLLFCGTLSIVLYYGCVTKGILSADKLFRGESRDVICYFVILPVFLFFVPVFSILTLILGTLRDKFSGFFKNLLLLAAAPAGFLIFAGTAIWQFDKIYSGRSDNVFAILAAAAGWMLFIFLPYGSMLLHGKCKKDKMKFLNGITGLEAVNSFLLGIFILSYICRNR